MTYEDAYLDGFCKAAEAAGVNPVQLYKKAGIPGLGAIAGVAGRALGAVKAAPGAARAAAGKAVEAGKALPGQARTAGQRFLELLKGGNKEVIGDIHANRQLGEDYMAGLRAALGQKEPGRIGKALGRVKGDASRYIGALRGNMGGNVASELRKVLAARLGTGAAGLGAAGAGVAALTGGKPDEAQA